MCDLVDLEQERKDPRERRKRKKKKKRNNEKEEWRKGDKQRKAFHHSSKNGMERKGKIKLFRLVVLEGAKTTITQETFHFLHSTLESEPKQKRQHKIKNDDVKSHSLFGFEVAFPTSSRTSLSLSPVIHHCTVARFLHGATFPKTSPHLAPIGYVNIKHMESVWDVNEIGH